jgi:hypothetical protein
MLILALCSTSQVMDTYQKDGQNKAYKHKHEPRLRQLDLRTLFLHVELLLTGIEVFFRIHGLGFRHGSETMREDWRNRS